MKFKKFIAALSSVAMIGSIVTVVPAMADDTNLPGPTITKTYTAKDIVKNKDDSYVKVVENETKTEIRVSSCISSDSTVASTLKEGLFDLGALKAGETVTVSARVKATAGDLLGVGLYSAESGKTDPSTVRTSGTAIATMGTVQKTGSWPYDGKASVSTFTGCNVNDFKINPGKIDKDYTNTISYTVSSVKSDMELYFIAAAWDSASSMDDMNRKIQVVDFTVKHEYSDLTTAVSAAADGDTIVLSKEEKISQRLGIEKSLTIKEADDTTAKITASVTNTPAILIKKGKTVKLNGIDITNEKKGAIYIEDNNTKVSIDNANITGDVYQNKGSFVELTITNTTVSGNIYTAKAADATKSLSCTLTLTNVNANSVKYNGATDTYSATNCNIGNVINTAFTTNSDSTVYSADEGVDDQSKALGILTSVTGEGTINKVTWNVTADNTTKSFKSNEENITIDDSASTAYFGAVISNFANVDSATVTATVE